MEVSDLYKQKMWEESCLLWCVDNRIKNEKGQKLEFNNHRFLKDIYDDLAEVQVARKASQMGYSVMKILKTFWLAKHYDFNIIYTLPSFADVGQLVPSKVNALISQNPILQQWTADKDTIFQKKVGNAFIYYRGTISKKSEAEKAEAGVGIMFSADLLCFDEADRCYEPGTEVLTKNGWKEIKDISKNDYILTLRPDTHFAVWKKPKEIIKIDYKGKLYRFIGKSLNVAVSENHKMWARINGCNKPYKLIEAKNLIGKKFVLTSKMRWNYAGKDKGLVELPYLETMRKPQGSPLLKTREIRFYPKKVDGRTWYRFLGWYLTEGSITKRRTKKGRKMATGNISISQKDERNTKEIVETIKNLGYSPKVYKNKIGVNNICFSSLHLALYLQKLGRCDEKYLSKRWLWGNPEYLKDFIDAAIKGDGDDRNVITTTSKKLADCYQIAALRIGKTASIYKSKSKDNNGLDTYRVGINEINYRRFNGFRGSNTKATVSTENYNGNLWCLSVPPYHTILVRGKDKKLPVWSGNSDQNILEQYESRLEASQFKGKWYFSNPTVPNTLTQKLYEQSDQKHWFVKCDRGHWQYLDYWKNVRDYKFVCEKCGIEITDENRRQGQWVKKYQNRDISGYWLPHLLVPWISAKQIQTAYENKSKQYFYNFVLGLPYIGSDVTVNKDIILRNIDLAEPNFQENNVLGVDQGLQKHWVLGNKQGIFATGQTDDWQDIEELIRVYDVETAIFDALPDLTEPRKLRDKYPGKIWLSYYKKEIKKADYIFWDDKTRTVYSDRSKMFQQVIDEMVNRKIKFQMKKEDLGEYARHWTSLYKTTEKDNLGIERDIWQTTGEDHFCHATILWRLALERAEEAAVKEWKKTEPSSAGIAPEIKKIIEENEQYE